MLAKNVKCRMSLALYLAVAATSTQSQMAAPTTNILTRVTMVESATERGTIFSIDVDGREYWVTAKHILTGARHPPFGTVVAEYVDLKLVNQTAEGQQWMPMRFKVLDPGKDVDIVALAPAKPLLTSPLPSLDPSSAGALLGGDCEFLGFPYGGGYRAKWDTMTIWMPFVKHCTVSAFTNTAIKVWILDGINNAGFSGGPVLNGTGPSQKIMGVISGYQTEPTEVVPPVDDQEPTENSPATRPIKTRVKPSTVNLNSGFIFAYDISYALDAIRANPVGPLREAPVTVPK